MSVPSRVALPQRDPGLVAIRLVATGLIVFGILFAVFGLPALPTMWPMYKFGVVLPSCGLTRGVVEIFRGDLGRAWRFNPASFLVVAVAPLVVVWPATWRALSSGSMLAPASRRLALGVAVVAVAVLWIHQQANADFVMHARL